MKATKTEKGRKGMSVHLENSLKLLMKIKDGNKMINKAIKHLKVLIMKVNNTSSSIIKSY